MGTVLIKTDRNGTKYYASNQCPKCGGKGYLYGYEHVAGGVCFLCGGTGFYEHHWKEYTPEYAQKLADRRLAKAKAKAPELNQRFLKKMGFSEDGMAWIVNGDTYSIKDELKAEGATFGVIGWHFDHEVSNHDCFPISIEDITYLTIQDTYDLIDRWKIDEIVKELKNKYAPKTKSEYIGNVGDKLSLTVKFIGSHSYETHFTYRGETHYILKFADENGNTVIWNTSSYQDLVEGKEYQIRGTVKEHSEYRGDKQTVLMRCKLT